MHGFHTRVFDPIRLSANVVESSWLMEADRAKKILSTPLEEYKELLDAEGYGKFLAARTNSGTKSWYSKNMTIDAAVYIMAWTTIEAGRLTIAKAREDAKLKGEPWTQDVFKEKIEEMTRECMKEWYTKLPKLAVVTNPALGEGFIELCGKLYKKC